MSRENSTILVGIDVGTSNVRTNIAQQSRNDEMPRVIGVSSVPYFGIRRGVITDVEDVAKAINESVEYAERMAGQQVKRAVLNIGGCDIGFQKSKGVIAIGRA